MDSGRYVSYLLKSLEPYRTLSRCDAMLDFGCGVGTAVLGLRERGYRGAHGFDIARERVEEARDRSRSADIDENVFFCDARDVPDDHYAACFSNTVLEHVADLDQAARMLSQKLRPDGVFLAWYPARFGIVEEHVFVPFAHWLPPGRFRSAYCDIFHRHGSAQKTGGASDHYLREKTRYRTARAVRRVFSRWFEEVRFVGLEMMVNRTGAQAPLRRAAQFAKKLDPLLKTVLAAADLVAARLRCRYPLKR